MKHDKILARLDSMMTRIGSSVIGVNTAGSDFDFATSLSMWGKIYPILVTKLGFTEWGVNGSGRNSKYGKHLMFNVDNVKLVYDGHTYDFIIYDGDNIVHVNTAMRKFKLFIEHCPSILTYMKNKQLRIETFQHFLQNEFNDTKEYKTDEDLLDDIFAGM